MSRTGLPAGNGFLRQWVVENSVSCSAYSSGGGGSRKLQWRNFPSRSNFQPDQ